MPQSDRAKLAREFRGGGITPAGISYLKKKLASSAVQEKPLITEAMTTAEIIRKLPECRDGSLPKVAAQRLKNEFGRSDSQDFWKGYEFLMTAIWRGTVDAEAVAWCFEYTRTKRLKSYVPKPGNYFWKAVRRRTGIKGSDLERLAAGG